MILCDPVLCRKLEADFRQYYQADLRDVFDPAGTMTVRWAMDMLEELPLESRFVQDMVNDPLTTDEHILLNIFEMLEQIFYQVSLTAAKTLGKEYRKFIDKGPKSVPRPTVRPIEKPKPVFTPTKDLMKMFGN